MYDVQLNLEGIMVEISFHGTVKEQVEDLNKIVKMILKNGESILELKNNSEFILVEPLSGVGIFCSIYVTGYDLEIEVVNVKNNSKFLDVNSPLLEIKRRFTMRGDEGFKIVGL